MNGKVSTFLHILDAIGHVADPRIGQAIDAGKALAHAKSNEDKVAAALDAAKASLSLAGDLTGKTAISDPALGALVQKYVEDGLALHAYIEAHKAAHGVASAESLGVVTGSTGE